MRGSRALAVALSTGAMNGKGTVMNRPLTLSGNVEFSAVASLDSVQKLTDSHLKVQVGVFISQHAVSAVAGPA